ncbi:hypothetical protein, partial [Sansalvadorimonas verongulae]|uniref:hypothetical protein n=1 Tax=Sansalvadorimonas verongulae TaxID=2172824 RepID=UPI0018AD1501
DPVLFEPLPPVPGFAATPAVRAKKVDRIKGDAAGAGSVPPYLALGVTAAPTVRVKQAVRSEGGAAGAGGVPLSLAPGVAAALA